MRKERKGIAMPTVQGLLTALVVIFGMMAVGYVTVALSGSQQFSTSSSTVNESSLALVNQTTAGQQGGASSLETVSVSIPTGSGDQVQVSYLPDQVTVVIGVNNTVSWVNNDSAPHTVTANGGSFDSGNMGSGGKYTYTFTTPGTYRYNCLYHSWMVGTVIVKTA